MHVCIYIYTNTYTGGGIVGIREGGRREIGEVLNIVYRGRSRKGIWGVR